MAKQTSSAELAKNIEQWEPDEVCSLIKLLKSRLSGTSRSLTQSYSETCQIPSAGTVPRAELSREIVDLLGWYGSNSVAYVCRKWQNGNAGKSYLGILNDVVRLLNNRLAKKDRQKLPMAAGVVDLEQRIVEILLRLRFHNMSTEEIVQILEESGLEKRAAKEAVERYGPGLAGASLPILAKLLGKKTVMKIVQELLIGIVGKFLGKQAAREMAKRLAVKMTQKLLTKLVSVVGWILLGLDLAFFLTSPARRITIKVIPFICLVRVRDRLGKGEGNEDA